MLQMFTYFDYVHDLYMRRCHGSSEYVLLGGLVDSYTKRDRWQRSDLKEIKSLVCEHNVWNVLTPLPDADPMSLKWVHTVKPAGDLKSRLVVRGFKMRLRVHQHEKFSPLAKLVTARIFLTLVASYSLQTLALDVKTAFLNTKMEREV